LPLSSILNRQSKIQNPGNPRGQTKFRYLAHDLKKRSG
jgi:hypothetical protein